MRLTGNAGRGSLAAYVRKHGFGATVMLVKDRSPETKRIARVASLDGYMRSGDADEITVYYDPKRPRRLPHPRLRNDPAVFNPTTGWNTSTTHAHQRTQMQLDYTDKWVAKDGSRWNMIAVADPPKRSGLANRRRKRRGGASEDGCGISPFYPASTITPSPMALPMALERAGGRTEASRSRSRSPSRSSLRRRAFIVGRRPLEREPRGSSPCPRGQILRASYSRKSTSSKGGKRVHVRAKCIKAQGLSAVVGRTVQTGFAAYKLKHEHILRKHRYSQSANTESRRRAINSALKEWKDPLGLIRHMQVIVTRSRNRAANRQGVLNMARDIRWLGKKFGYKGYAQGRSAKSIRAASSRR